MYENVSMNGIRVFMRFMGVVSMSILWTTTVVSGISPLKSSFCADQYSSACGNGGGGSNQGYACPHMMMLSDEMIRAARSDGLNRFVYAVAGGSSDRECGACYQVQLLDAEREWRKDFPYLIVQIVNSGFDVLSGQLDIFMGAGGFGYFTACNQDCSTAYCQGGPCSKGMYEGNFKQWVNAQYNDPNLCYSGGIKWLDKKNTTDLYRLCKGLSNNKSNTTTNSCVRTNLQLFHQNFVSTRYERVQCPPNLYHMTGLHRLDDNTLPLPSLGLPLTKSCTGSRAQGHFCVTTMQDCCKMSCSWGGKIPSYALDPTWPCIATCHRNGSVISR